MQRHYWWSYTYHAHSYAPLLCKWKVLWIVWIIRAVPIDQYRLLSIQGLRRDALHGSVRSIGGCSIEGVLSLERLLAGIAFLEVRHYRNHEQYSARRASKVQGKWERVVVCKVRQLSYLLTASKSEAFCLHGRAKRDCNAMELGHSETRLPRFGWYSRSIFLHESTLSDQAALITVPPRCVRRVT